MEMEIGRMEVIDCNLSKRKPLPHWPMLKPRQSYALPIAMEQKAYKTPVKKKINPKQKYEEPYVLVLENFRPIKIDLAAGQDSDRKRVSQSSSEIPIVRKPGEIAYGTRGKNKKEKEKKLDEEQEKVDGHAMLKAAPEAAPLAGVKVNDDVAAAAVVPLIAPPRIQPMNVNASHPTPNMHSQAVTSRVVSEQADDANRSTIEMIETVIEKPGVPVNSEKNSRRLNATMVNPGVMKVPPPPPIS
jgi:hypothetical protein